MLLSPPPGYRQFEFRRESPRLGFSWLEDPPTSTVALVDMGSRRVTEEQIAVVRSVVGRSFPDMEIIRALHLANNDPTAAINIIFDAPARSESSPLAAPPPPHPPLSPTTPAPSDPCGRMALGKNSSPISPSRPDQAAVLTAAAPLSDVRVASITPVDSRKAPSRYPEKKASVSSTGESGNGEWWLVGRCDLAGFSTCKGRRLRAGESVSFSFPYAKVESSSSSYARFPCRGRSLAFCSEIVRFSTGDSGEVGTSSAQFLLLL